MSEVLAFERWVQELRAFPAFPEGVLYRLRQGDFDPVGMEDVIALLQRIAVPQGCVLPRRFVARVWWLPLSMAWQVERVEDNGGDVALLRRFIARAYVEVERILGVPGEGGAGAAVVDVAGVGLCRDGQGRVLPFERWLARLEAAWAPGGVFQRLEQGGLDPEGVERVIALLQEIPFLGDCGVPRRLVSLVWTVPYLMRRQVEPVILHGGDADTLWRLRDRVINELDRVFSGA